MKTKTDYEALTEALGQANLAKNTHFSPMAHLTVRPIEGGYWWTVSEDGRACGGVVFLANPEVPDDGREH
jgi:hypothetical protein